MEPGKNYVCSIQRIYKQTGRGRRRFMLKTENKKSVSIRAFVTEYIGLFLALAALLIIFGFSANNFFTLTTFRTIANQIPDITSLR
jgi:hypothetical protein